MSAQHAVRVGVLAGDEALGLLRRHAATAASGDPAASVRRSEQRRHRHRESSPFERHSAPRYVASGWDAGSGGLRLRRLARRRRAILVAGAAARSARPLGIALFVDLRIRGLAGPPGRPARGRERRRARIVPGRSCLLDLRLGALRRRGRRADQVRFEREWSALRRYAASRGVRLIGDIPLYVGARSADHLAHPELFQRGFVAGAPPDTFGAVGTTLGQSALRLDRAAPQRLPLVDRAPAPDVAAVRPGAHRSLPRLRGLLVGARARAQRAGGPLAARARPSGVRRRAGGARRAAADRRGPGRDHAAGRAPPAGARPARHGRAGVRVPRRPRNPHRPENHVELLVVYTGTHDTETAVGWWNSLSPRARSATGLDPAEPHWSLIELALASPRGALDPARAGPARPRQRGTHEPAGNERRKLALAAGGGRADRCSGRAAARGDRAQRAPGALARLNERRGGAPVRLEPLRSDASVRCRRGRVARACDSSCHRS